MTSLFQWFRPRSTARSSRRPTTPRLEALESRDLLSTVPMLDTTFNHGGKVLASWASGPYATVTDVLVLPSGKIMAIGQGIAPGHGDQDLFIARFNADGSPDNTFDPVNHANHRFYDPFGNHSYDWSASANLLGDGSVIVSGSSGTGAEDLNAKGFLLKFTSAGLLDRTFGSNGIYTDAVQSIQGVAVQGSRLLIGGTAGDQFAVSRLTSSGRLDTSSGFGNHGRLLFDASAVSSLPVGTEATNGLLSVRDDGSFVYSGVVGDGVRSGFVANFTAQGLHAPAFGSPSGELVLDYGGDNPRSPPSAPTVGFSSIPWISDRPLPTGSPGSAPPGPVPRCSRLAS
jgi:uncharacterized delta-60 repeat protein